jgi:hypothetical protein
MALLRQEGFGALCCPKLHHEEQQQMQKNPSIIGRAKLGSLNQKDELLRIQLWPQVFVYELDSIPLPSARAGSGHRCGDRRDFSAVFPVDRDPGSMGAVDAEIASVRFIF